MQNLTLLVIPSLSALTLLGADSPSQRRPAAAPVVANATNRLAVTGMHCDGCAKGIASELKRAPGGLWPKTCRS